MSLAQIIIGIGGRLILAVFRSVSGAEANTREDILGSR